MFSCTRVQNIWKHIGIILNLDITWSHIILGLNENDGTSIFNKTRNNIITIAAYSIYATWVKCGNDKENFKYIDLNQKVQSYFIWYQSLYKHFKKQDKWFQIFFMFMDKIIHLL